MSRKREHSEGASSSAPSKLSRLSLLPSRSQGEIENGVVLYIPKNSKIITSDDDDFRKWFLESCFKYYKGVESPSMSGLNSFRIDNNERFLAGDEIDDFQFVESMNQVTALRTHIDYDTLWYVDTNGVKASLSFREDRDFEPDAADRYARVETLSVAKNEENENVPIILLAALVSKVKVRDRSLYGLTVVSSEYNDFAGFYNLYQKLERPHSDEDTHSPHSPHSDEGDILVIEGNLLLERSPLFPRVVHLSEFT